jgi:hypothetical protein
MPTRWTLLLGSLFLAVTAYGQQTLPTRLVNAALFKNGYACLVREVTVPAGEQAALILEMPVAVHGTFWLLSPPGLTVKSATATEGDRPITVPAISISELLRANLGESLEIKTKDGWTGGKLLAIADDRKASATAPATVPTDNVERSPYYWRPQSGVNTAHPAVEPANLLTIETADGVLALPVAEVQQLRKRPGTGALKTAFSRGERGAMLRLQTAGAGGTLQIAYLTRGLTWAPSYRLDLSGKLAHLQAKAVLINDAEDLVAKELTCIAGFPNVKFAQVEDPLSLQGTITQFLTALQQPSADGTARSSVTTQAVMFNTLGRDNTGVSAKPEADDDQDLHFYPLHDVTLRRGDRAYLPLLELEVPFSEVYRWDARDLRERMYDYGWRERDEQRTPQSEDVWHAVRFRNTGKQVLTTAPVTVVEKGNFIGQDILYYTSAGGVSLVNITKAVDVKAKFAENTLENKESISINNRTYRIFIVGGKLTVSNFKPEPIRMVINKKLTGDLIYTSTKPSAVNEEPRRDVANAHSTAVWELTIPAGQTTEIEYKYKIFVP